MFIYNRVRTLPNIVTSWYSKYCTKSIKPTLQEIPMPTAAGIHDFYTPKTKDGGSSDQNYFEYKSSSSACNYFMYK